MFLSAAVISLCATTIVTAQTNQFDMECYVLLSLEELMGRLTSTESTFRQHSIEHATEIADLNESLANAESRTSQQTSEITDLRYSLTGGETDTSDLKVSVASSEILQNDLRDSLTSTEAEIAILKTQLTEFASRSVHSTYVGWGKTSCPGNGSELVYAGSAGRSYSADTGASVDYLCLPTDPDFSHYESTVTGQDVPCAVCKTKRSTVLMVPAKTTCHDGWTLEYKGYLSSGADMNVAATHCVCLDDQPEYIAGGAARIENSKKFHFVESRCGGLKCPPYVDGRELTCAVCSL